MRLELEDINSDVFGGIRLPLKNIVRVTRAGIFTPVDAPDSGKIRICIFILFNPPLFLTAGFLFLFTFKIF
jgi:hypothetical protein